MTRIDVRSPPVVASWHPDDAIVVIVLQVRRVCMFHVRGVARSNSWHCPCAMQTGTLFVVDRALHQLPFDPYSDERTATVGSGVSMIARKPKRSTASPANDGASPHNDVWVSSPHAGGGMRWMRASPHGQRSTGGDGEMHSGVGSYEPVSWAASAPTLPCPAHSSCIGVGPDGSLRGTPCAVSWCHAVDFDSRAGAPIPDGRSRAVITTTGGDVALLTLAMGFARPGARVSDLAAQHLADGRVAKAMAVCSTRGTLCEMPAAHYVSLSLLCVRACVCCMVLCWWQLVDSANHPTDVLGGVARVYAHIAAAVDAGLPTHPRGPSGVAALSLLHRMLSSALAKLTRDTPAHTRLTKQLRRLVNLCVRHAAFSLALSVALQDLGDWALGMEVAVHAMPTDPDFARLAAAEAKLCQAAVVERIRARESQSDGGAGAGGGAGG